MPRLMISGGCRDRIELQSPRVGGKESESLLFRSDSETHPPDSLLRKLYIFHVLMTNFGVENLTLTSL